MSSEKTKKHEEKAEPSSQNDTKCEGQSASSVKGNSCFAPKALDRGTEMPQRALIPCWDNMPSVILLEIFSYLPRDDRIQASQVCKNWRSTLFHPSFWKQISFNFRDEEIASWSSFLGCCFGLSVQEATINWNEYSCSFKDVLSLLKKLSQNRQLKKLVLNPVGSSFQLSNNKQLCMEEEDRQECSSLVESVTKIAENANALQVLNLGCIEEIAANIHLVLEPLKQHHAKHLTHLSLASVKDDPFLYEFIELDSSCFKSFLRLSMLSIDYEFVSDTLLMSLDNGLMERLVIHVHGWENTYFGTSNHAWLNFVKKNPRCELRMSFIHACDAVPEMNNILKPAMPLTHLKILFCENINTQILENLSQWHPNTLRSFILIDSYTEDRSPFYVLFNPEMPDPLVLMSWKCTKLQELVMMGYHYLPENLMCIARLRDKTLKNLVFRERDLMFESSLYSKETVSNDVKNVMGENWKLLSDNDLPPVMKDSYNGDSREVIMPLVVGDQF